MCEMAMWTFTNSVKSQTECVCCVVCVHVCPSVCLMFSEALMSNVDMLTSSVHARHSKNVGRRRRDY